MKRCAMKSRSSSRKFGAIGRGLNGGWSGSGTCELAMSVGPRPSGEQLSVEGLSISFGDGSPLFTPLSFSARSGEIVALIGPSGVGKTSILRAISGLIGYPLATGAVQKNDVPSIVFQEDRLLPWCDLLSNTVIPIELERKLTSEDVLLARGLLERLRLSHASQKLPAEVSGGMRQRIAVARALVRTSSLLLLDEPFTALDFDMKIGCQRLILDHVEAHGVACVMVTHDIDDAVSLASHIIRINAYPDENVHIPVNWPNRPRDPLSSRQSIEHFNLVKEIMSYDAS